MNLLNPDLVFNRRLQIASLTGLAVIIAAGSLGEWWTSPIAGMSAASAKSALVKHLNLMPLSFESNMGQTAKEVSYLSRSNGYILYFTPQEMVLDFRAAPTKSKHGRLQDLSTKGSNDVLRVQFVGANQHPTIVGDEKLKAKSNYFIGNDPNNWHKNIPNYSRVDYQGIYPGIDMTFYGNQNQLEYDIKVAPAADPNAAQFHFVGAKDISLNTNGSLDLTTPEGKKISMHKPIVYQTINGTKHEVSGKFKLLANKDIGFDIGKYDKSQPLIIDPVLTMSTFIGGSGGDNTALAIAVRDQPLPHVYITGYTNSTDFPTVGPFQSTNKGPGRTAFVLKYDRDANAIEYSTYLGGSGGNDEGFAITTDSVNAAYITGETNSKDFPLQNPFQLTNKGARDFTAFVTKLNPEGDGLVYSTYLGGSGENQEGNGIAVDINGFAYVTGETTSTDFPTKNPFQATNKGPKFTAYLTKLNTLGNGLVYSTYLGGSGGQDEGNAIKVDSSGNVYITGETNSKDFPTLNPIQPTPKPAGAAQTGFVTKINSTGTALVWSTYLGGSGGNDYPTGLDIDDLQAVYITGYTNSSDFPVKNPVQATNNGPNFTGFITKINPEGDALDYSTYIGGSGGNDRFTAMSVDIERKPHVCGYTNSHDFPLKNALQSANLGAGVTTVGLSLNADGGSINNSSYIGGSGGNDRCFGVAMDGLSSVYHTGLTNSADFPILNAIQPAKTSAIMAYLLNVSI